MQTKVERPEPGVEIGIVTHEGREFAAMGSVVKDGRATGYPQFPEETVGAIGEMRDWEGNRIGSAYIVHRWPIRSHWANCMMQIEACIDGKTYTGRGMGSGMLWRGRLKAGQ